MKHIYLNDRHTSQTSPINAEAARTYETEILIYLHYNFGYVLRLDVWLHHLEQRVTMLSCPRQII